MTNLKALRLIKDWSQEDVARRLGCDVTTLSRLENNWFTRPPGAMEPKLKTVFGDEWTFQRLMEPPPEPRPDASAAE